MKISIFGKRIEIPDWFRQKVEDTLQKTTSKYFDNIVDASVTFEKASSFYTCDIHVHVPHGISVRSEGEANDVQNAFDDAIEHVTRRLRRYNSRLKHHRNRITVKEHFEEGRQYILQGDTDFATPKEVSSPEKTELSIKDRVITKKATAIASLTIYEAIMHLDLSERPVLMFRNIENKRINVVYRQNDGRIAWLDSGIAD